MPVATRPRLFSFYLLPLLVAFACLMSGCQSSRPSFVFQPTPLAVAPATAPLAEPTEFPAASASANLESTSQSVARPHQLRPAKQLRRRVVATHLAAAAIAPSKVIKRVSIARRHFLTRPQAPAESGLGLTVLGLLGMVAVVVGLIGLAISGGGLAWIIVAGAGALAVLLAYIDPSGR